MTDSEKVKNILERLVSSAILHGPVPSLLDTAEVIVKLIEEARGGEKKWCEHIVMLETGGWNYEEKYSYIDANGFNLCPKCGKPHPLQYG